MSSRARRRQEVRRPAGAGRGESSSAAASEAALTGRIGRFLRRPPAWAAALALALLHLVLALIVFDPTVFMGGDNAAYLALARSLLDRHRYLSLWEPLVPPHTQYPPVFPGMIAIGLLLGMRSWVGIKLIVVACSTAAVAFTYLWLRRRRRPGLALAVAGLIAVSPGVLTQSHIELSDVPFFAFAMVALWAFERLGRRDRVRFAVGVAAIVLANFTRSAGLPLVLAAFAWLAWRRRWRQLAILAAVVLPLSFLWWLRGHVTGGSAYVQLFWYVDPYRPASGTIGLGDLFHRIFANERAYLGQALPVLLAEQISTLVVFLSYAVALLGVFGWVMRLRRAQLAELFFPLYIGLLFVWPEVWAGERFLLPAYPLLLAYAGDGLVRIVRRVRRWAVAPAGILITSALALLAMPSIVAEAGAASICRDQFRAGDMAACLDPSEAAFLEIALWARNGLPAGANVISRKPRIFYVYSGHRSHDIPTSSDPRQFLATLREQHTGYVVLDVIGGITREYVGPIVTAHPDAFCLLHATEDGNAALLKLQPDAPALLQGPPHPSPSGELSLTRCTSPAGPTTPTR